MPGGQTRRTKPKRRSWYDRNVGGAIRRIPGDFLRGGKRAARGLPTGIMENAKLIAALQQGNTKELSRQGRQMARSYEETVRNPLRDPFQTSMLLLALAGGTGGAVSRTAAAGRAARGGGSVGRRTVRAGKAFAKKPTYTRRFRGSAEKPGQVGKSYEVRASRNPIVRGARKPLDAAYEISRKRGEKKLGERWKAEVTPARTTARTAAKDVARLRKERQRLRDKGMSAATVDASIGPKMADARASLREKNKAVKAAEKDVRKNKQGSYARGVEQRQLEQRGRIDDDLTRKERPESQYEHGKLREAWNAPMNLLRTGMVWRPRYFTQNLATTLGMLLAQQGPHGIIRSANTARKVKKQKPELFNDVRASLGDPAQASYSIGSTGKFSGLASRHAAKASIPEAYLRTLSLFGAARARGAKSPADLEALYAGRTAGGSARERFYQTVGEAREEVGDFGHLGPKERAFMRSQIPIFYPMWKAMARWGLRYPTEHSLQAALLSQMGAEGYEQMTEDFPGVPGEPALPPWFPYLMKTGEGMTSNPQNIHPWSPAADVTEAGLGLLVGGGLDPTRNLGQFVGPAPELAWALATGRQLQTGWPVRGVEEGQMPIEAASRDFAPTIPFSEWMQILGYLEPRKTKAYGEPSKEDILKMLLFGPITPRRTDIAELRSQARAAKKR